ncbi:hypothetical protein AGMMS50262_24060 [Bacteroidia bacterium]|nr:hypothetical protein AGMMS50262_24060 [Bacteroidia bacterium]
MIENINIAECLNLHWIPKFWEHDTLTDAFIFDTGIVEKILYRCNNCEHLTSFKGIDFQKHKHNHFSNLWKKDGEEFDNYLKDNNLTLDSYLDFYCPNCYKPVRIYFSDGYGGKGGDYIVKIEYVFAIKPFVRRSV